MTVDPIHAAIAVHREHLATLFHTVFETGQFPRYGTEAADTLAAAKESYEAHTDRLIATPVTTMAGVCALTAHLASLQAYGRPTACYAIEPWHLSEAMEAIAGALMRLAGPTAPTVQ